MGLALDNVYVYTKIIAQNKKQSKRKIIKFRIRHKTSVGLATENRELRSRFNRTSCSAVYEMAGNETVAVGQKSRDFASAAVKGPGTAGIEFAAGRWVERAGNVAV